MSQRAKLAAILVWAALLFGLRLPLPLLEPEETRYAEIPRQMLAADSWLVPVCDGQPYLDKPPLLYWLVMGSFRLFGDHIWSARLVTAITAWLTVLVVYAWGRRIFDERTGLLAALTLTLFGDFVYRAPMLTMNGPLALFVAVGLWLGHAAGLGATFDRRSWSLAALATAVGVLMKGPVAIVLIVGPLALLPWLDRRWLRPRWFDGLAFAAIVALVAGPWFLWMAWTEPTFVDYFFLKHHVERFVSPFDHAKPFWFYLPQWLVGILPWSLLLLARIGVLWRSPGARLLLVAGLGGLLFFTLSGSKRPVYLVPIYAPLALAVGELLRTEFRRSFVPVAAGTALVMLVGVVGWLPIYSELHTTPRRLDRPEGRVSPRKIDSDRDAVKANCLRPEGPAPSAKGAALEIDSYRAGPP